MPSTAISAQGSTLEIGTGSGSAVVPTAVTAGNPTIMTKSTHGLSVGDVVDLAGITGADAAVLNGQRVTISHTTANTFAFGIDTTGKTVTVSGSPTVTPVTWTQVKNLKSFSGFDGQASELDKTNLDSTAKEIALGLVDNGMFSAEIDLDNSDAGQVAARAAKEASSEEDFRLTLPDDSVATFSGYVKKMGASGGVDALVKSSIDIRISGAVTWA